MDKPGRHALLVSSSRYSDPSLQPLGASAEDAEALAGVLGDPTLGGYRVRPIVDQPSWVIAEEVERFFAERGLNDVSLFYFSGHGIKDEDGALYFAAMNTKRQLLLATAIPSEHIVAAMRRSRSRRQVLLLDCCFGGAFSRAVPTKADERIGVQERFSSEGAGRIVITASDTMQYAFVGDELRGEAPLSVFTSVLVEGIRSGEADQDRDGKVDVDELFDYVSERVPRLNSNQTPTRSILEQKGDPTVIAFNVKVLPAPSNLTATGGVSSTSLFWSASSDNVAGARYNVHRSTEAGFIPSEANRIAQSTGTSHTDSPLSPNTYYYRVTAEDGAGNMSEPSDEASAVVGHVEAPKAPSNLTATGGVSSTSLFWSASSDNVAGARYNVHRSTEAGFIPSEANRIAQSTGTSHTDSPLSPNTYYYRVTAEDGAGNMSEPSDEASAVVRARRTVWVWVAAGAAIVVAAVVAVAVLLVPDDGPAPLVEDDFSTQKYGWPDVGEGQVGGSYVNGGYRILAEREADQWGVIASPTNAPTANDVRITVDARRVGGSSLAGYGYGIFCRATDQDNLYTFTVWASHARIEKRLQGAFLNLSPPATDVSAPVDGDAVKGLKAVCATVAGGSAVELEFWVDGKLKLRATDSEDPLEEGDYGVFAALGRRVEPRETLEVEFDNFAVAGD